MNRSVRLYDKEQFRKKKRGKRGRTYERKMRSDRWTVALAWLGLRLGRVDLGNKKKRAGPISLSSFVFCCWQETIHLVDNKSKNKNKNKSKQQIHESRAGGRVLFTCSSMGFACTCCSSQHWWYLGVVLMVSFFCLLAWAMGKEHWTGAMKWGMGPMLAYLSLTAPFFLLGVTLLCHISSSPQNSFLQTSFLSPFLSIPLFSSHSPSHLYSSNSILASPSLHSIRSFTHSHSHTRSFHSSHSSFTSLSIPPAPYSSTLSHRPLTPTWPVQQIFPSNTYSPSLDFTYSHITKQQQWWTNHHQPWWSSALVWEDSPLRFFSRELVLNTKFLKRPPKSDPSVNPFVPSCTSFASPRSIHPGGVIFD